MTEVERVQYRGALAVTGTWRGSSQLKLYEELGWESLSDRRKKQRQVLLFKIVNNLTPAYLRDKLPPLSNPFSNESFTYREFRVRTERFRNTFFPDVIKQWNALITDFTEMPTLEEFRSHLHALYRPLPKETYRIHDPEGLRYLFQLRVGLSPLRYHKKRHHFADTPDDTCLCNTGIETVEHFLFKCPFYTSKRLVLAQTVIPILINHNLALLQNDVNLYLYGHKKIKEDNKDILLATISFIKSSNRFD